MPGDRTDPEPIESREWYSIADLGNELGVSTSTLYKWVGRGTFPAYTRLPNGQIRVHRHDLESWMLRQRVAA